MEIIRSITVFVWKITLGCLHRYLFVSMSVKILFVFISDKRFLQFLVKTTSCLHRVRHILTLLFWQKFSENLFGSCRRDTLDLLIPPPLGLFIYSKEWDYFASILSYCLLVLVVPLPPAICNVASQVSCLSVLGPIQ